MTTSRDEEWEELEGEQAEPEDETYSHMLNIPEDVREFVLDRDNRRCRRCGKEEALTLHHVQKRSAGRNHHPDNLVTLCWWDCHRLIEDHLIEVKRINGGWYFTPLKRRR